MKRAPRARPTRRVPWGVLLLPGMLACGGGPTAPSAPPLVEAPAASSVPLRGAVSVKDSVLMFRECGDPRPEARPLTGDTAELAAAVSSLEGGTGVGIHAEVVAQPSGREGLVLTELVRAKSFARGVPCDEPVFDGEFKASGNEPFWAVEIRDDGIVYRTPELPRGRRYPYARTPTETGAPLYATRIDTPSVSTLEVALEPGRCVDTMSGELRSFKAHVVLDGAKREGCAFAGVPRGSFGVEPLDELGRWAGTYLDPAWFASWDPAASRLRALLGGKLEVFERNMSVRGPLMQDQGVFYTMGNAPHRGGLDSAVFLAEPSTDTIVVILLEEAHRSDFREGGRDVPIPAEVRTYLANFETP